MQLTGARSLKATIENAVKNARWDALYSGKKEIILAPENILDEDGYSLVKKEENNKVKKIEHK